MKKGSRDLRRREAKAIEERIAAVHEEAERRVRAVWECAGVLRPDLVPGEKRELAQALLTVAKNFPENSPPAQKTRITAAQVMAMVNPHLQCVHRYCPLIIFTEEIAQELNEFFGST